MVQKVGFSLHFSCPISTGAAIYLWMMWKALMTWIGKKEVNRSCAVLGAATRVPISGLTPFSVGPATPVPIYALTAFLGLAASLTPFPPSWRPHNQAEPGAHDKILVFTRWNSP